METKPIVVEAFTDNGQHSHWRLIDPETGYIIWTEDPEEDYTWKPNGLLRPCDCRDQYTADILNEQGLGINDDSIHIEPSSVILTMGHTTIKIWMKLFKQFAEWYLEPQEIKEKIYKNSNNDTSSK
jgi:hypothetical protein